MKKQSEYQRFSNLADRVISTPHSEVKAKLDAEKAAKKRKKAKA
jgi:hypothetical protein